LNCPRGDAPKAPGASSHPDAFISPLKVKRAGVKPTAAEFHEGGVRPEGKFHQLRALGHEQGLLVRGNAQAERFATGIGGDKSDFPDRQHEHRCQWGKATKGPGLGGGTGSGVDHGPSAYWKHPGGSLAPCRSVRGVAGVLRREAISSNDHTGEEVVKRVRERIPGAGPFQAASLS